MKSPILEKLDRFRHLIRRQTVETVLERTFSGSILIFFMFFAIDYCLWSWKFLEISLPRWSAFLIMLVFWIQNLRRFGRIWRQIPHTRSETLNLLLRMNHHIHSNPEKKLKSTKLFFHKISFIPPQSGKEFPLPIPKTLENALDFLENPQPETSRSLAQAVVSQTEKELKSFHPEKWMNFLSFWRSRNSLRFLTFLAGLFLLIFTVQSGEKSETAAQRMLFPWSAVPWKLDFRPQWRTLPTEVFWGDTFSAELSVCEEVPFIHVFLWESEKAAHPFETLKITPIFGQYRVRIPNVKKSFFISAAFPNESVNEAPRRFVRLQTHARLTDALIRIQPPAETCQPPAHSSWDISGLPGSSAGIMIETDRPLKEARLRFSNSTYVPGIPAETSNPHPESLSRVFKFRFELLQDCQYFLELTDTEGITTRLPEHSIRLLDDLPPVTQQLNGSPERPILPGAKIRLQITAQDDFGLSDLGFRWIVETPLSETGAEQSVSRTSDTFEAPRSKNGSLKWTGFTVWSEKSASIPDQSSAHSTPPPFPLSLNSDYEWDLSMLHLESGMRIRLETFASDLSQQRAFSSPFFLRVATPEEMRMKTFRQWIGITQEMRRIAEILDNSRQLLSEPLTMDNLPTVSSTLTQSINTVFQLLDVNFQDSLPNLINLLKVDLSENPEFPFHDQTTSKEQLNILLQLQETIKKLSLEPLASLNQEIVSLVKIFRSTESNIPLPENFPLANGIRIREKLELILEILHPQVKLWQREEHIDVMRLEFNSLKQRQNTLWTSLQPHLAKSSDYSPMEIRQQAPAFFQNIEQELWNLRKDTESFCSRFSKIIEETDNPSNFPLSLKLLTEQENTLFLLKNNRFWELWRSGIQLRNLFEKAEKRWITPEILLSVRQRLLIFNKMLATQEKILNLLEKCASSELTDLENETKVILLNRNLRTAFRDCASIQQQFGNYFVNHTSKSDSTPASSNSETPIIPKALVPFWLSLCENLTFSSQEFRTIASSDRPPLELLQDQFTLQLQIYDQLAELAQIANGISEESGEWTVNKDFENRLAEKKSDENQQENESVSSSNEANEMSEDSEEKNSSSQVETESLPEIKPEDIQILISMQENVLSQTRALAENNAISSQEKALETEFLTEQERKIADSAKNLGFDALPNSSFDSILAQIYQVSFLLEKQDLGKMTISIQEEIIYGLRASLQRKKTDDDFQKDESNTKSKREIEDLSQNTDSTSRETRQDSQTTDSLQTPNAEILPPQTSEALKKLQNSFWGELPQRQLDQLELIPEQKPIDEYRKMIELYYQKLNE